LALREEIQLDDDEHHLERRRIGMVRDDQGNYGKEGLTRHSYVQEELATLE
jgi:hypothetical protein